MTDQPITREEIERWRALQTAATPGERHVVNHLDGAPYPEVDYGAGLTWKTFSTDTGALLPAIIVLDEFRGFSAESRSQQVADAAFVQAMTPDLVARLLAAAEAHLSEPDRIAVARHAGYGEGIEAAARYLDEQATGARNELLRHARARDATKGLKAELMHARRAASAEAAAGSLDEWASAIRALAPPPAWAPTHRHYKGKLYRVTGRGRIWAGNDLNNGVRLVDYENEAGELFSLPVADFDGMTLAGERRYAPIPSQEPTDAA